MSKIISISLDDGMLEEILNLEKEMGFSGRSEMVREGMRALLEEKRSRDALSGDIECILIAMHGAEAEDEITEIKHRHEKIIKTQIHSNLKGGKCLELFVIDGNADKVRKLSNELQSNRK